MHPRTKTKKLQAVAKNTLFDMLGQKEKRKPGYTVYFNEPYLAIWKKCVIFV
mgnify:CR=1 FL=1